LTSGVLDNLQLELPSVRETSRLFNIAPQGLGTLLPEACTSFLSRLSEAHSVTVSTLLACEVAPIMGELKLVLSLRRGSSRIYSRPTIFNGQNQTTEKMIKALEILTGQNDLRYLTLLPLKGLIDCKGVFHSHRVWCSQCLETWRTRSNVIYEALPWTIWMIKVCPAHGNLLSSQCPQCKSTLPVIARTSRVGYCSHCNAWLGRSNTSNSPTVFKLSSFDNWAARNISLLLAAIQKIPPPPIRSDFTSGIIKHIDTKYKGSASAFARALTIPSSSVKRWRARQSLPTLYHLLSISFMTRTPLIDLLTKGITEQKCTESIHYTLSLFPRFQASQKKFDYKKAKCFLEKTLRDNISSPPSMNSVTKKLGYSKKTLYKHFPALCRGIAAKSARYRSTQKKERLRQGNLFVEHIAEQLHLDGIYPSYDAVEKESNTKGILRSKDIRLTWHKKLSSLGLRDN
jgi:hypothetical protein